MSLQQDKPTHNSQKLCKNHPDQVAEYFIVEQPWQKLCKQCALNRALCGYKIDRQLSSKQFQNKLTLNSLIDELKNVLTLADEENKNSKTIMSRIQKQYYETIGDNIDKIDEQIKNLCMIRDSISKVYEESVRQKISQYSEHQNKVIAEMGCLRKYLENLETNYSDLIADNGNNCEKEEEGENNTLERQVKMIRKEIQVTKKGFIAGYEIINLEGNVQKMKISLNEKFQSFNMKVKEFSDNEKNKSDEKDRKDVRTATKNKQESKDKDKENKEKEDKILFKSRTENNQKEASSVKDYKCLSQRKKSILKESIDENSIFTHRPPSLSLKGQQNKRNNSIQNISKVPFEESLRMARF